MIQSSPPNVVINPNLTFFRSGVYLVDQLINTKSVRIGLAWSRAGLMCHQITRRFNKKIISGGNEPDVNRTRNLLIWSQTRYHCATDPLVDTYSTNST